MQELGTDLVLVCSNASADCVGDERILLDDLSLLAEHAGRRGLRIGYEALAWGKHVNTWQQVWNLVRQVDHNGDGGDHFEVKDGFNADPTELFRIPNTGDSRPGASSCWNCMRAANASASWRRRASSSIGSSRRT